MKNLLEAYKQKIAVADAYHAKLHEGAHMDNTKKLMLARCLENTSRFLNEAFDNSEGVQRSDMGAYKRFCLNLNTVVLPNLIIGDLMITQAMSSYTGLVTYLDYCAGSNKGGVDRGTSFNSVFALGQMTEERMNYTSQAVVETFSGDGEAKEFALAWTPVAMLKKVTLEGIDVTAAVSLVDGKVVFENAPSAGEEIRIAYAYDNEFIPANDIPTLSVKMRSIPLTAHARRIAVFYSNLAAFQAKNDYGLDLAADLASQAVAELSYEIDAEGVKLLEDFAEIDETLTWSKTQPVGVNLADHFQSFVKKLEDAKSVIYKRTQKFSPNCMICSRDVISVLTFINGWQPANVGVVAGPYFAGTVDGLKVFVSPMLAEGKFIISCKGNDMATAPAVYAPYMPIIPTQLLEHADGASSRGWSTMYDMQILSKYITTANGKMNAEQAEQTSLVYKVGDPHHKNAEDGRFYSPLLVAGLIVE